ncbi:MAG: hypothetical protein LBO21_04745 [Synergistaceae bacterium]|jgi:hypothetical protein|nr:hypothetical protein [Synergistaceae bacterium]
MSDHGRARRKRGFSLVIVLGIAIAGMSLLGGMMYTIQSFSGAARVAVSDGVIYNILQDGVERGKARLKELMHNTNPPPLWTDKPGVNHDDPISSVEDLLLVSGNVPSPNLNPNEFGGKTGSVKVEIFDMQYDTTKVTISNPEELAKLPPSYILSAGGPLVTSGSSLDPGKSKGSGGGPPPQCGVYLIRATLEIDGREEKVLETSVIQSNLL